MKEAKKFRLRKKSIRHLLEERKKLSRKFVKLYGSPVLIHATQDEQTFLKIIEDEKLKIPSKHKYKKRIAYMEKLLEIEDGIYFSFGFAYATDFNFKYNFLFNLNLLKDAIYFNGSLLYRCCKEIANYWSENDPEYLEKLRNFNEKTKEVVDEYYTKKVKGKTKVFFAFYKIEPIFFQFVNKYKNRKKLIQIINKKRKELEIEYPESLKFAKRAYLLNGSPEAIFSQNIDLKNNKDFLGFYIKGEVPKKISKLLSKKFPNKILFDGKKVEEIK